MNKMKQMIRPYQPMLWLASLCLFLMAAAAIAQDDTSAPIVYVDDDGNAVEAIEPAPAKVYTAEELSTLVAPVALYPDDLLAIVLPAATYPLQIVQAARFLDELEKDSTLKPDLSWDESVVALLNYPEAVRLLNDDLDWTWELGEAFLSQQSDVIQAVADFRRLAYDAGNLKTDEYQVVDNNSGTIQIAPANPEVIYVPYYEPSRVVVYQPYPAYYYYPRPYPVYYYPYPYGYSFGAGYFWGLTTAYVIGWNNFYLNTYYYNYPRHPYYGRKYYNSYRYYHPPRHRPYYTNRGYNGGSKWAPGPRYGHRPGYKGGRYGGNDRGRRDGHGGTDAGGGRGGSNAGGGRGGNRGGQGDGMRPGRDGDGRVAGGGNRGGGQAGRGNPNGGAGGAGRGGPNRGNDDANNGNGRGGNGGADANGNRGGNRGGNATPANATPDRNSVPTRSPRYVNDNQAGDRDGNHRRMVEPEVVSVRNANRNQRNAQQSTPRNRERNVDRVALADQIGQASRGSRGANSGTRQRAGGGNQASNSEREVVSVRNANRGSQNGQSRRSRPSVDSTRNALGAASTRQSGSVRGRSSGGSTSGRVVRDNTHQRQPEPVAASRSNDRSVQRIQASRPTVTNRNAQARPAPQRQSEPRQASRPQSQPRQSQPQAAPKQQGQPSRNAQSAPGQSRQASRSQRSGDRGSSRRGGNARSRER